MTSKKPLIALTVQITLAKNGTATESRERINSLHNALFEGAVGYLRQDSAPKDKVAKNGIYATIQA